MKSAPSAESNAEQYPATKIVHWPSGPVAACDKHAAQLVGLARFLGSHVGVGIAIPGATCGNCENEAAKDAREDHGGLGVANTGVGV